jgi:hypothetical protein
MIAARTLDLSIGTKRASSVDVPLEGKQHPMSPRAHLWLRIAAIATILAVQFGPRIWGSPSGRQTTSAKMAVAEAR